MLTVAHMLVGAPAPAHLGIVSFSDNAEVELAVQRMDKPGLTAAEAAIQGIRPGGCTNIWAGLSNAIDMVVAFSKSRPTLNCHILLLTDGEPTPDYIPLRGIVPAVANKLSNAKAQFGTTLTLSCFGFGYQLDTDLLDNLCKIGGGVYGYLPDCSMVGTVGIHYSASILSTAARNVELEFGNSVVKLGNIHVGQTCHFRLPSEPAAVAVAPKFPYTEAPTKDVRFEEALALLYTALSDGLNTTHHLGPMNKVAENIRELRLALSNTISGTTPSQILDILQDLDSHKDSAGQLTKAVSRIDWYNSWGKNHLFSYMRQLMNQTCMNFKDLAPQHFLAPLTKKLCDAGSDIFDSLPPPKPSIVPYYDTNSQAGYRAAPPLTTMAMFNDAGGGCWAGYCKVEMADGTTKYTSQIIPGDHVKGGYRVMAVVTTRVGRKFRMIQPTEGLVITPWHPVRLANGPWTFPEEIGDKRVKTEMIHYVYNLVLEAGHVVRIGGYDVCTLGHGFEDNDVIRHAFFGTARVIQDLRRDVQGWNLGRIELRMEDVRKDAETGLVSSIMNPAFYNNAVVPNQ
jgi:hypothetical protein